MNRARFLATALATAAISLSACVVAPVGRPVYVEPVMSENSMKGWSASWLFTENGVAEEKITCEP